jgi:hypothetical protein
MKEKKEFALTVIAKLEATASTIFSLLGERTTTGDTHYPLVAAQLRPMEGRSVLRASRVQVTY